MDAIVFEAERPELASDEADRLRREERLAIFNHLGATILSNTYVQPALTADRAEVPLILLAHIVRLGADRTQIIHDFCTVFMDIPADSPLVAEALRGATSSPPE